MFAAAQGKSPLAAGNSKRELRIAAASDLQPVMPGLAYAYKKEKGVDLKVNFGSSATLTEQIINGAPVDVFLAADFTFPEKIVAANLADARAPVAYAKGTLVLWARKDSPLQPLSMDRLTDGRAQSVAIANELHAPYGRAAAAALRKLNLYDRVAPHFVVAENIAQAGQYVESGNAQLGLISLTLAHSEHFRQVGNYIVVPAVYPEIRQCAVVLKNSDRRDEAHAFMTWLLSSEIQSKLKNVGLESVR